MRAVLLVAAAAAAENSSAWRERLGLQGSACPAECPLRHTPGPTASPVRPIERDQRSASVPMPPLLMRLINNLWS